LFELFPAQGGCALGAESGTFNQLRHLSMMIINLMLLQFGHKSKFLYKFAK